MPLLLPGSCWLFSVPDALRNGVSRGGGGWGLGEWGACGGEGGFSIKSSG